MVIYTNFKLENTKILHVPLFKLAQDVLTIFFLALEAGKRLNFESFIEVLTHNFQNNLSVTRPILNPI